MYPIQFPNSLDQATFLKTCWQKKHLYMPQAWPDFENPLPADELAGLALEEAFPARIVIMHSAQKWSLQHGPFSAQDFAELEGKRWSLLITDIEKHLPDFMQYVQPFRFIPDWRFDDFMISYAPPGGSVGPHMDDYDVFLIQAQGERVWQLEGAFRGLPMAGEELIPGTDLRLIKEFKTRETYRCKPGDILYLPPRLGHHGVASSECMTWSMGFKAPSFHDMLLEYLHDFEHINEHKRYTDPMLQRQENAGEITGLQLQQLKSWFLQQFEQDDQAFSRWVAQFLSGGMGNELMPTEMSPWEGETIYVEPNPFVRFNFVQMKGQTCLYINGEEFLVSLSLARSLTRKSPIRLTPESRQEKRLIMSLLQKGYLLQTD